MLYELRGLFTFALWDARKAMLLARDPYGIKPLYYADDGRTCRFASQVKALLTSPRVSRLPEPAGRLASTSSAVCPSPTLYQETVPFRRIVINGSTPPARKPRCRAIEPSSDVHTPPKSL